eukprot:gene4276-5350_t
MSSKEEETTLQNTLDAISSTYNSFFNELGINGDIDHQSLNPSLFHSFGSFNIDEKFGTLDKQLQKMKMTFQQYRQWEGERELSKFQTQLKQYHATQQKANQISKTLSEFSLIGKTYLDQLISNDRSLKININEGKRKISLLTSRLQEMTQELDQKYGTYSDLEELNSLSKTNDINPEKDYSCNISSLTFLLEIHIYGDGNIKRVSLVHLSMATGEDQGASEEFNNELTNALKTNIKGFFEKVKNICNKLLNQLNYNIFIEMEEGNTMVQLPTESIFNQTQSDDDANNQNYFIDQYPSFIDSNIRLICRLDQPLLLTKDILQTILKLSPSKPQQLQQLTSIKDERLSPNLLIHSIQNQLISRKNKPNTTTTATTTPTPPLPNQPSDKQQYDITILGIKQRYFYTGNHTLGYQIVRLPLYHLNHCLPMIQLLRQQVTWNLLFQSCFVSPPDPKSRPILNTDEKDIPIFEVTSNPPTSIDIIFLHPADMNFHSVEITVGLNGELQCKYVDSEGENNAKSLYFCQLLKKSLSIPISFQFILQIK